MIHVLGFAAVFLLPETAQDTGAVNTAFHAVVGRPILVSGSTEMSAKMVIDAGKGAQEREMAEKAEFEFLDEHETLDDEHEVATRFYVKAFATTHGEVSDPPINGLTVKFQRLGKDRRVELQDGRTLPKKDVEGLLKEVDSAGFWLAFPEHAVVGGNYKIDLGPLVPLLFDNQFETKIAQADVKLESFDPASGAAVFRGSAEVSQDGTRKGLALNCHYEGECVIETNVQEARIVSLSLQGKVGLNGSGGSVAVKGGGTYKLKFATQVGEVAAGARKRKPVHRDRVFRADDVGVAVTLPSFYDEVEDNQLRHPYRRLLDEKVTSVIGLDTVLESSKDPKSYFDALFKQLKQTYSDLRTEKVSSPLGNGQAFLITMEVEGKKLQVRSEFYPLNDRWVVFKLITDPKSSPAVSPEFTKARKTLKALAK